MIVSLSRSLYYYQPTTVASKDSLLIEQLNNISEVHPMYGFWKMYYLLRNQGYKYNHKRVYRLYTLLKMNLKRKRKRRLAHREHIALEIPPYLNHTWSIDFMSDVLHNGRRFRTFNVIDDYNREVVWLDSQFSIGAARIVDWLNWAIQQNGKPERIRCDNGPEFISATFVQWCNKHRIEIRYIQPGKPTQNAFIERFNRSYRTEVLDAYIFHSINEVKEISHQWVHTYNHVRPHHSLLNKSPIDYITTR